MDIMRQAAELVAIHRYLHEKAVEAGTGLSLKEFKEMASEKCDKEVIERYLNTKNATGVKAITMFDE